MKINKYNSGAEIITNEAKQARIRAIKNLNKAKELEASAILNGKRYKRINNKTYKLI